jgi:ankyrin repeat protein
MSSLRRNVPRVNYMDTLQFLIKMGAHVTTDHHAIHIAAGRGYEHVVHLLLDEGADIDGKDYDSKTMLEAAAERGDEKNCAAASRQRC